MSCWIEGPDNRRFFEIVDRLNADTCARRRYQLRCLEVPAMHLLAVWAYRNLSDQWFVPVSPLPISLPSGRTFDGGQFQDALNANVEEHPPAGSADLA
jgi:hypothetical protein